MNFQYITNVERHTINGKSNHGWNQHIKLGKREGTELIVSAEHIGCLSKDGKYHELHILYISSGAFGDFGHVAIFPLIAYLELAKK